MKTYAEVFAILSFEGLENALMKPANILSIYSDRICLCNDKLDFHNLSSFDALVISGSLCTLIISLEGLLDPLRQTHR